MSSLDLVLLDSNVPMYAAGAPHAYRDPCREVLRRVVAGELRAITNVEVHQELLHRYLALGLGDKAREVSEDFETVVPDVLGVSLSDVQLARRLSSRYAALPARDLLHVAVMLNNGVRRIVTADRHFDGVAEVDRIDPFELISV